MPPHFQTETRYERPSYSGRPPLPTLASASLGGRIITLGGLAYVAATTLYIVVGSIINSDSVRFSVLGWIFDIVQIFATLCFALGLVGLYSQLRRRSALGLIGLALVAVAFLASALPATYFAFRTALWAFAGMGADNLPFEQGFFAATVWTETLLLTVGVFLLGVATFRERILGRWRILPLIVSLMNAPKIWIFMLIFDTQVPWAVFGMLIVLRSLAWTILGMALWNYGSRKEAAGGRAAGLPG